MNRSMPPKRVGEGLEYESNGSDLPIWNVQIREMQYLNLIRYYDPNTSEKKELRILDNLSADWECIGEILGFRPPEIDAIRHAGAGKTPIQCLREIISKWMQNAGNMPSSKQYPCNWNGLYSMLMDSKHGATANDLKAAITACSSDLHQTFDDGLPPTKRCKVDSSLSLSGHVPQKECDLSSLISMKSGQIVRDYQNELAKPGLKGQNYIFVAPTGSGKTLIAAGIMAKHFQKYPQSCVAFIVPRKCLAVQQMNKFKEEYKPCASVSVHTGCEITQPPLARCIKASHIAVCTAGKLFEEIRTNRVKFTQFGMLVLDECHHTVKEHAYAKLMKCYLEKRLELAKKQSSEQLSLQIVGMTASLGAGGKGEIDDHLINLAAHLDATGGIISVSNPKDIEKYNKTPSCDLQVLKPRDTANDQFIIEVCDVMKGMEKDFKNLKDCENIKWSQEYETLLLRTKEVLETSLNSEFYDKISTLNELWQYSTALSVYMDLQDKDALKVLQSTDFPKGEKRSTHENELERNKEELVVKLKALPTSENPLLSGVQNVLCRTFEMNKTSRGIIFVRTLKNTIGMKNWIATNPKLKELGVTPATLSSDDDNLSGQTKVIKKFDDGNVNVLITTSMGEEGLDIPQCNLVIRYQYVSNEIANVQAKGRARAEDSECYTIVSSTSKMKAQEIRNNKLILEVDSVMKKFSIQYGDSFLSVLRDKQEIIIQEKVKKFIEQVERRKFPASSVLLHCKKCKAVACLGSDISTLEEDESHHLVCKAGFENLITTRPYEKPRFLTDSCTVFKKEKILCKGVNEDKPCRKPWGVRCVIMENKKSCVLLSCKAFTFEIEGETEPHNGKKWPGVPFDIEPASYDML